MSASPRVRDRLRSARDGARAVVHSGRHAVYVDLDGWCLGVVGRDAALVPNALRLATDDLAGLEGAAALVDDGLLHLDGTPLRLGRLVETRVPRLDHHLNHRLNQHSAPPGPHPAEHPALPGEVIDFAQEAGLLRLPHRSLGPADVARLLGRGGGLTPLGDDVLCGWLAAPRAAGRATRVVDAAVGSLLPRTTLLSATLLDCALHGEVLPEFAGYLASIDTPEETSRAAALAAVGNTSGAGLLLGALLARADLDHTNGVAA